MLQTAARRAVGLAGGTDRFLMVKCSKNIRNLAGSYVTVNKYRDVKLLTIRIRHLNLKHLMLLKEELVLKWEDAKALIVKYM